MFELWSLKTMFNVDCSYQVLLGLFTFDQFWNNPLKTWKNGIAQIPKHEVSSSKTEETVIDWKMWPNAKLKDFLKLRDLRYVKVATYRRQSGSHFAQDGPILPKLVSMAS